MNDHRQWAKACCDVKKSIPVTVLPTFQSNSFTTVLMGQFGGSCYVQLNSKLNLHPNNLTSNWGSIDFVLSYCA